MAILDVLGSLGKATSEQLPGIMQGVDQRQRRAANAEFGAAFHQAMSDGDGNAMDRVIQDFQSRVDPIVISKASEAKQKWEQDDNEQTLKNLQSQIDIAPTPRAKHAAKAQMFFHLNPDLSDEVKQGMLEDFQNQAQIEERLQQAQTKQTELGVQRTELGIKKTEAEIAKETETAKTGVSAELAPLVDAVMANPQVFEALPSSTRAQILPALSARGFKPPVKRSDSASAAISDFESGMETLDQLEKTLSSPEVMAKMGPFSGTLTGMNPWDVLGQSTIAEINGARQTIGKALEGGVLRKEDEEKYKKILPTIQDTPEVALNKIKILRRRLLGAREIYEKNVREGKINPDGTVEEIQKQASEHAISFVEPVEENEEQRLRDELEEINRQLGEQ